MIIDHIGISVADFSVSRTFYAAALAPLGIGITMKNSNWAMVSSTQGPEFWFGEHGPPNNMLHLAFAAASRQQVDDFHAAALKAGATDNGAPGLRPDYHANYYGAFVIDPNGHNLEAVCHSPVA